MNGLRAVVGRLLQSLLVLLVMSALAYGLIGLMPGDPIDLMISTSPHMTAADGERLRALHGLDQPLSERYFAWLTAALHGDWGVSRLYAAPVIAVIGEPLQRTLLLVGLSLPLALMIALPLGLWAALRPGTWIDGLINLFAFATLSMPVFWLGLMAIIVFAVTLGWLPAGGLGQQDDTADRLRHLMLPVGTLALGAVGPYTRHMRAAMKAALQAPHIRTARAKGASVWRIVVHHALRAALLPVVTVVALDCGALLSGALITETVFAYPGMGKLTYDAVMGNDYALALACLLLATAVTLAANALADGLYRWLDPRTRVG
jgi:peptide/nickel transport system permease protein